MRFRTFLSLIALVVPLSLPAPAAAQDTVAIKQAIAKQYPFARDTIDKDKSRPAYVKRAQDSIIKYQAAILAAMRKPVKPDTTPLPPPINKAPVPSFTYQCTGTSCTFDASASTDDKKITLYTWAWGDGRAESHGVPCCIKNTWATGGMYTVTLTAADSEGLKAATQKAVVIGTAPIPPPDTTTPPVPPDTTTPPPVAGFDGPAELPRARVDVTLPTGYTVVNVPAQAGALQAALDAAGCRTELRGAPGFSYVPLTLRQKPCNERYHTIIRTANALPDVARGTRMTPLLSAQRNQTKIVTTGGNVSAVTANAGVHGYYFEDVNIRATGGPVNGLVTLGTQQTTLAQVPGDFVFSHVYTGGTPTVDMKRCWYLNSLSTAIVDSWSDECHSNNGDSQWILMLNGPGPYDIRNNYGEAGHEVVMLGGGDPSIQGLIPSDITLIGNHITRPVSWKGVWQVKNLIECKNARRMLVEGNVVENNWADGQVGYAFLCKSVNQDLTAPWSQSRDITVRYNLFRNTGAGYNLCGVCQAPAIAATAMSLHDNVMIGVNVGPFQGEAREWQFLGALSKISVLRNTTINAAGVATAISFDGQPPKITAMDFSCNAYDDGQYGIHGGSGGGAWTTWVDSATSKWRNNLNYPIGAWSAAGFDARGFYSGTVKCFDGTPVGADAAKVYALTAKAVVLDPTRSVHRRAVARPRQTGYRPTTSAERQANTNGGGASVR
jgi:hypothetical protein